jgi:signal recognition particle subunit SRP54
VDGSELGRVEAMIQSMTGAERRNPDLMIRERGRTARVAKGSGRAVKEVTDLVKRFGQMRDVMASLGSGGGLLSRIPGLGRLAGAGGAPGQGPAALLGAAAGGGGGRPRPQGARDRKSDKRKRKQAKKARRKGRRR